VKGLSGPYYAREVEINGVNQTLEIRFCNPAYQKDEDSMKALIYQIVDGVRNQSYTGDSSSYSDVTTQRTFDEATEYHKVSGIFYKSLPAEEGNSLCYTTVIDEEEQHFFW
jgi:hypothetical protein